jgi:hypothetical protein
LEARIALETRTCYLHVGTHKTGSTSIQAFITMNASAFSKVGLLVPNSGRSRSLFGHDICGHHNIAWQLNNDARFTRGDGTLDELLSEMTASPLPACVVSSEDFEYLHALPEVLGRLAEDFRRANYRVQPIVVLRNRASYAESLYAELIKHGLRVPFSRFMQTIFEDGAFTHMANWRFAFEYSRLINVLENVFEAIPIILTYDDMRDSSDLLLCFARVVAQGIADADLGFPPKLNPGLTFGQVLQHLGASSIDPELYPESRFQVLTSLEVQELRKRFAHDDAALSARYGIAFDVKCGRAPLPHEERRKALEDFNGL